MLSSEWLRTPQDFDIGLVNYPSGIKRYGHIVQRSLREIAEHLAVEISQLSPRRIVLVGHSMGGLIAKETVRHLDSRFGPASPHTSSIAGIVTLGTPSAGSAWAKTLILMPGAPRRDRSALSRHSSVQRGVEMFFSTRVDVGLGWTQWDRLHLPLFSASASRDVAVEQMGAELGAPAQQRMILSGTHSGILETDETSLWLRNSLSSLLAPRSRARVGPVLSTEFNGSAAHPAWESAYHIAMTQFQDQHGDGSIVDFGQSEQEKNPHLIVRAYNANYGTHSVPHEVMRDVARQDRASGRVALGISPIGTNAATAVARLAAEVDAPRLRWFRGVADSDAEIIAAFKQFFDLSIGLVRFNAGPSAQMVTKPWEGMEDGI